MPHASCRNAVANDYFPPDDIRFKLLRSQTSAVLVDHNASLDEIAKSLPQWTVRDPHHFAEPWTDDFSNIVSAIAAHSNGGSRGGG